MFIKFFSRESSNFYMSRSHPSYFNFSKVNINNKRFISYFPFNKGKANNKRFVSSFAFNNKGFIGPAKVVIDKDVRGLVLNKDKSVIM